MEERHTPPNAPEMRTSDVIEPESVAKPKRHRTLSARAKITNSAEYRQARPLERARMVEEASPRGFAGDLSKALKLRLQGLSIEEIAKLLGVGATTIQDNLKHFDFIETDKSTLGAYVDNELEVFDYIRLLASKAVILQLADSERSKKLDIMRLNSLLGTNL
jgi:hypothetical protein